jgi:hypothetical protein
MQLRKPHLVDLLILMPVIAAAAWCVIDTFVLQDWTNQIKARTHIRWQEIQNRPYAQFCTYKPQWPSDTRQLDEWALSVEQTVYINCAASVCALGSIIVGFLGTTIAANTVFSPPAFIVLGCGKDHRTTAALLLER